jgi:heme/copper-type cytochrome/quinol oxidase subunit 2
VTRRVLTPQFLQWFGLLGAPFAWALQHVTGFALTLAACDPAGSTWSIALDGITTAVSIVAVAVALAAGAAAVASWAQTRGAEKDDPPPDGRRYFLALVGIAITPLFVAMILMTGSGVLDLSGCRQS